MTTGSLMMVESIAECSLLLTCIDRPDSSVGRASAFVAGGRGFESRPHHTKGVKNGTSNSLADTRIKRGVLGRKSKAGKYLLTRYCYVAIKALQSLCCLFQISRVK